MKVPSYDDVAALVGLLAGVWTAFQEWRHRKDKKAAETSVEDALKPTPIKPKAKGKK